METEPKATYRRRGKIGTLKLAATHSIDSVDALKQLALEALADAKAETVKVDASETTSIDTASWQLIFALVKDIRSGGRDFELRGPSTDAAGFSQALGSAA